MSTWSCRLPGAESMGALPICLLAGLLQAPPSFSPRGAADRRAAYGGAPRGGHRAQGHAMLLCFARGYSCTGAMRRRRFPPACVQRRLGAVRARRALIAVTAHLLTGWIPWGAKTGQDCILLSPRSALSRAALCLLSSPRSLPSLRLSSTPTPLHRPTSIHPSSAPPLPLTLHGNLSARRPLRARAAGGIGERQGRMGVVSCQHVCDRERMKLHGRRCTSSAVVLQLQWGKQYALEASARAYIDCQREALVPGPLVRRVGDAVCVGVQVLYRWDARALRGARVLWCRLPGKRMTQRKTKDKEILCLDGGGAQAGTSSKAHVVGLAGCSAGLLRGSGADPISETQELAREVTDRGQMRAGACIPGRGTTRSDTTARRPGAPRVLVSALIHLPQMRAFQTLRAEPEGSLPLASSSSSPSASATVTSAFSTSHAPSSASASALSASQARAGGDETEGRLKPSVEAPSSPDFLKFYLPAKSETMDVSDFAAKFGPSTASSNGSRFNNGLVFCLLSPNPHSIYLYLFGYQS
ncbi:hypothetical protein B0H13DRAFT_1894205 [Mycena leptocephala]|nr:hypothetical protein B0H13DRAFT_1894205 [Mycena leptocephala]